MNDGGLVRYQGGGGSLARGGAGGGADAGAALAVDDMQFSEASVLPVDIPGGFLDASVQLPGGMPDPQLALVSSAQQRKGVLKVGEVAYQVREFTQVFPHEIVTSKALRPLVKQPDGRYKPSGPWGIAERTTRAVSGTPLPDGYMVDDTLTDPTRTQQSGGGSPHADPAANRPEFAQGAFAQAALPSKARMWLNREVPDPSRWEGAVLRWDEPSGVRETVEVIRGDDRRVAVIKAERPVGAAQWKLLRRSYELVGQPVTVGGMPNPVAAPAGEGRRQVGDGRGLRRMLGR